MGFNGGIVVEWDFTAVAGFMGLLGLVTGIEGGGNAGGGDNCKKWSC